MVSREAGRRLRDGGRVINLSTSIVETYFPHYGVYAAEALTHVLLERARRLGRSTPTPWRPGQSRRSSS